MGLDTYLLIAHLDEQALHPGTFARETLCQLLVTLSDNAPVLRASVVLVRNAGVGTHQHPYDVVAQGDFVLCVATPELEHHFPLEVHQPKATRHFLEPQIRVPHVVTGIVAVLDAFAIVAHTEANSVFVVVNDKPQPSLWGGRIGL